MVRRPVNDNQKVVSFFTFLAKNDRVVNVCTTVDVRCKGQTLDE